MHTSTQKVANAAEALGLKIEIITFEQSTRTAEEAAAAIGCEVAQIVKSLVFTADGKPVIALVSGSNQLDTGKLAALLGVSKKKVKRADAEVVKAATGYSIGGVPPFGHVSALLVYVDQELMRFQIIWAAAGTPNSVFAIAPEELVRASAGVAADLAIST
jgi:Cys-tRNA(Pro) deacylase